MVARCSDLALVKAYADAGLQSYLALWEYGLYNDNKGHHKKSIATHGAELNFVWSDTHSVETLGHSDAPSKTVFTPQEQHLANMAMSYWGSFAASGNPNSPTTPVHWPAATPATAINSTLSFKIDSIAVVPHAMDNCALWGMLGLYPLLPQRLTNPCAQAATCPSAPSHS